MATMCATKKDPKRKAAYSRSDKWWGVRSRPIPKTSSMLQSRRPVGIAMLDGIESNRWSDAEKLEIDRSFSVPVTARTTPSTRYSAMRSLGTTVNGIGEMRLGPRHSGS